LTSLAFSCTAASDPRIRFSLTDRDVALDEYSLPAEVVDQTFSGQGMENIYIGIGAALYLVFVAWCIVSPHK
jgi:hypothetical protein